MMDSLEIIASCDVEFYGVPLYLFSYFLYPKFSLGYPQIIFGYPKLNILYP